MKNMTFSEEIKGIRQKNGLKVERTNDMAKKKTVEKALNIDNILFNCRDILRAARNSVMN